MLFRIRKNVQSMVSLGCFRTQNKVVNSNRYLEYIPTIKHYFFGLHGIRPQGKHGEHFVGLRKLITLCSWSVRHMEGLLSHSLILSLFLPRP